MHKPFLIILIGVIYLSTFTSCKGEKEKNITILSSEFIGKDLFFKKHSDGNSFSCSTCHALIETGKDGRGEDGMLRAANQLGNSYNRSTFKNGKMTEILRAVNSCRQEWMNAPAFTEDQPNWLNLKGYLEKQAKGRSSDTVRYTIIEPAADLTGGEPKKGMELFNGICAVCHEVNATGSNLGPAIAGTSLSRDTIAKRIRTSGSSSSTVYEGLTGGKMPFYSKERLSDTDMRHILAYLEDTEAGAAESIMNGERINLSQENPTKNCDSNHPLVGASFEFSTLFHDVSGIATIVDNCTIHLDKFNFDGGGIDVRIYTGRDGDFQSGKSISRNMLGIPFHNEKATLSLPSGTTLEDFNSLSIWCVPIGISFGDGTFTLD